MIGAEGRFARQHPLLYLQIVETPLRSFHLRRNRILAERKAGARRIEHAYRLVGQLPARNISVR